MDDVKTTTDDKDKTVETPSYKFDINDLPRRDVGPIDPDEGPMAQFIGPKIWFMLTKLTQESSRTMFRIERPEGESWYRVQAGSHAAEFNTYNDASMWAETLYSLVPILQDWLAKDKALRVLLAKLVGAEHIPHTGVREHYESLTTENIDMTDMICHALGHKPMQDTEDASDLLRRVFVWGADEDPNPDEDDDTTDKPCAFTIVMTFEEATS